MSRSTDESIATNLIMEASLDRIKSFTRSKDIILEQNEFLYPFKHPKMVIMVYMNELAKFTLMTYFDSQEVSSFTKNIFQSGVTKQKATDFARECLNHTLGEVKKYFEEASSESLSLPASLGTFDRIFFSTQSQNKIISRKWSLKCENESLLFESLIEIFNEEKLNDSIVSFSENSNDIEYF